MNSNFLTLCFNLSAILVDIVQAFEEAELPRLKEEKPGLTHNQYKDMIWKLWKKSPDNPLNQVSFITSKTMLNAIVYRIPFYILVYQILLLHFGYNVEH